MTAWAYDVLGNKQSQTDALGRTVTYTLDGWRRVTNVAYSVGGTPAQSFTYNEQDALIAFSKAGATTACTYDDAGRITSETTGAGTLPDAV